MMSESPSLSCIPENKVLESKIHRDRTLIIFDWDDTMMCSSFMAENNITLNSESILVHEHWNKLDELSKTVIEIVTVAKLHGEVVIITNADHGWVELSAQKFMPELIPILKTLTIISAKTSYEGFHPGNLYIWKYLSMRKLISQKGYPDRLKKNIISFGDSLIEREGIQRVAKEFSNTLAKSVKFEERSNIENLTKQLFLLKGSMKYIVEYDGILDLQMTVKKS